MNEKYLKKKKNKPAPPPSMKEQLANKETQIKQLQQQLATLRKPNTKERAKKKSLTNN